MNSQNHVWNSKKKNINYFNTIEVYGMGKLEITLVKALKELNINIKQIYFLLLFSCIFLLRIFKFTNFKISKSHNYPPESCLLIYIPFLI